MKTTFNILYLLLFMAAIFAITYFLPSWVVEGFVLFLLVTILLAISALIKTNKHGKDN